MRTRFTRLAFAAGAAGVSLALLAAGPAGAAPAQSLGQAGSDTTYFMMQEIVGHYNKSVHNINHDKITEIPPTNSPPFPSSVTVPADGVHPAMTWNASNPPPNGSSAGITALENDTTGQIAFARSSRGPNAGETAKLNFWAYALGAVDYVTFPGTKAPAGLTQQQLIDIYTCGSNGLPIYTNWHSLNSKVPPTAANHITKFAPQAGSGTLSFFQTKLLDGFQVDQNCNNANLSIRLEEHDATGITNAQKPTAIYMYDWGKFRAQTKHFEKNLTNGARMGKFGPTKSTEITPSAQNVNEGRNRFFGTRYLFNVDRKAEHPASDANQLTDINRLIGVAASNKGGPQYICSGDAHNDIAAAGFVPLPKESTGGVALPKSYCRLNPRAL